jgi:2-phospho-L-lactate transferase/gluconeogenesis factor (CofD/UPF0052 family)
VKIVIFTGGTGSTALQRGLYQALDSRLDGIQTRVIVNAYDNGLSTGAVRHALKGLILGPSDVRKNHTTRLQLLNPKSPWLKLLKERFTAEPATARGICWTGVTELKTHLEEQGCATECCNVLCAAIDEYFNAPLANRIEYTDFSLSNVIYAGLASMHGFSLRTAATCMTGLMGMPDHVLLNDDRSLFLGAITRNGRRIADEGEIVRWGDESDPLADVFFVDVDGREARPQLCVEAQQAITRANLIILSSGTQWSSLIPTYASKGFKEAVRNSNAKILMVMNRTPDRDSPSQTASDLIEVLVPRYFDSGRLHVIADRSSHAYLRTLNTSALGKIASFTQTELSTPADPPDKHNPEKLATAVGRAYFDNYLGSSFYLFDYDDTIVGRDGSYPTSSAFNAWAIKRLNSLTDVGICTGNTIKAVDLCSQPHPPGENRLSPSQKSLLVYADGGVNEYSYPTQSTATEAAMLQVRLRCIAPEAELPIEGPNRGTEIVRKLQEIGVPAAKIHCRGNALIAIRPIEPDRRGELSEHVRNALRGSSLQVRQVGRTTIEICKPELSKLFALKQICTNYLTPLGITYVGDELDSGNDRDIKQFAINGSGVKCLHVDSPAMTAFFITTLLTHLCGNG